MCSDPVSYRKKKGATCLNTFRGKKSKNDQTPKSQNGKKKETMTDRRLYFFALVQRGAASEWAFLPVGGFERTGRDGSGISLQTWKVVSTDNEDAYIKSGTNYVLTRSAYSKEEAASKIRRAGSGEGGMMDGPDLFQLASESLTPGDDAESMLLTVWKPPLLSYNCLEMAYKRGTDNMYARITLKESSLEGGESFEAVTDGILRFLGVTCYEVVSSKELTHIENFVVKDPRG